MKTTFVLPTLSWSSFSIVVLAKGSIFLKLSEPSWSLKTNPGTSSYPTPSPRGLPSAHARAPALTKAPLLSLLNSSGPSAMLHPLHLCFSPGLWSLISTVPSTVGSHRVCLFIYFYYYYFSYNHTCNCVNSHWTCQKSYRHTHQTGRVTPGLRSSWKTNTFDNTWWQLRGKQALSSVAGGHDIRKCPCNLCHGDLTMFIKVVHLHTLGPIFRDIP